MKTCFHIKSPCIVTNIQWYTNTLNDRYGHYLSGLSSKHSQMNHNNISSKFTFGALVVASARHYGLCSVGSIGSEVDSVFGWLSRQRVLFQRSVSVKSNVFSDSGRTRSSIGNANRRTCHRFGIHRARRAADRSCSPAWAGS